MFACLYVAGPVTEAGASFNVTPSVKEQTLNYDPEGSK
jgi:hypothetical protein